MNSKSDNKNQILIADDSEMNREILTDMLEDEYEIITVENGIEAVAVLREKGNSISLVLLDIVMPEMDGFGVLKFMNAVSLIEEVPVIMITSENSAEQRRMAFDLGVTDFINRPFDNEIVHRRVVNTILLYVKQKELIDLVANQLYEKERQTRLMIEILSHIVEFRNGESGMHINNVHIFTELLLQTVSQKTDKYKLTPADISLISTASSLHDVGKISVPHAILNKPGRLTPEEFEIMKTHTVIGAKMLCDLHNQQDEPLIKTAYNIIRWHHERYDGKGYPDGLVGDDIPIEAQIVALADVYDALTSERVYKKAIPHEKAIEMIMNGECGTFNPLLLEALGDVADYMPGRLQSSTASHISRREIKRIVEDKISNKNLTESDMMQRLLDSTRMKNDFFAEISQEIQFEYTVSPPLVHLSALGAKILGLDEITVNPKHNEKVLSIIGAEALEEISKAVKSTTESDPNVSCECMLNIDGAQKWFKFVAKSDWSVEEPPKYIGAIGKLIDINESKIKLKNLEKKAAQDNLTGLLNHAGAHNEITKRLTDGEDKKFAFIMFDIDNFKQANDNYGHDFGDRILKYLADCIRKATRSDDISARFGGDEFIIFICYENGLENIIERYFKAFTGICDGFKISISMGIAKSEDVGYNYDKLFKSADKALYYAKRTGKNQYKMYDSSAEQIFE